MRKFMINVNGTSYEVEVEEIKGASSNNFAPAPAPVAASAPAAAPAPAPSAAPASKSAEIPATGRKINAPIPGTIVTVNVAVGDTVNKGDCILVVEAMKMENEILAPVAGKITAIPVSKGAAVNSGDLLAVIE